MPLPLSGYIGLRYTGSRKNSQFVSFLSGVSMLGLVVGVALLLTVLSVMNGFDRELRERILSLVPQGAVYSRYGITDWRSLQHKLERRDEITAAAPFVELHGLVANRGEAVPVLLYGVDPAAEVQVSDVNRYLNEGTLAGHLSSESGRTLILGQGVAEVLNTAAGERVMLVVPDATDTRAAPRVEYFSVAAILSSGTELDNALALTSLETAAALAGREDTVTGMRLQFRDLFDAPRVVHNTLIDLGPNYYGTNWMRTHGNLYQAIQMSKSLVSLLVSLIVAIAAFNVVSALVMVVVDKQSEIAILRTLGASTGTIMRIFMVQGSAIGIVGTTLGVLAGLALSAVVEKLVQWVEQLFGFRFLKSDVYPLSYLPADIRLDDVVLVAVVAVAMSFCATLYPAWRASRVQPAEALRFE